ncbi:pyridoxal biosynthesis lyase PdxS [Clostridium beijerinckii]|nr:pyridoxal biosynthesis lyase PdxS [Clostridium beijerinckii]
MRNNEWIKLKEIQKASKEELMTIAKNYGAPYELVKYVWEKW